MLVINLIFVKIVFIVIKNRIGFIIKLFVVKEVVIVENKGVK